MLKKPEMILIDVDGTLVDSVPDLAYCVDATVCTPRRKQRGWFLKDLCQRVLQGSLDCAERTAYGTLGRSSALDLKPGKIRAIIGDDNLLTCHFRRFRKSTKTHRYTAGSDSPFKR